MNLYSSKAFFEILLFCSLVSGSLHGTNILTNQGGHITSSVENVSMSQVSHKSTAPPNSKSKTNVSSKLSYITSSTHSNVVDGFNLTIRWHNSSYSLTAMGRVVKHDKYLGEGVDPKNNKDYKIYSIPGVSPKRAVAIQMKLGVDGNSFSYLYAYKDKNQ